MITISDYYFSPSSSEDALSFIGFALRGTRLSRMTEIILFTKVLIVIHLLCIPAGQAHRPVEGRGRRQGQLKGNQTRGELMCRRKEASISDYYSFLSFGGGRNEGYISH